MEALDRAGEVHVVVLLADGLVDRPEAVAVPPPEQVHDGVLQIALDCIVVAERVVHVDQEHAGDPRRGSGLATHWPAAARSRYQRTSPSVRRTRPAGTAGSPFSARARLSALSRPA